jgi:transketolase
MYIALAMARSGVKVSSFIHRHAVGYPTGRYGSQKFHQAQCGLDADGLHAMISGR